MIKTNIVLNRKFNFLEKNIEIISDPNNQLINIDTFNRILSVLRLEKIKTVEEYYKNLSDSLLTNSIDWSLTLPVNRKLEYSRYLKESLLESEKYITEYFYNVFPKRLKLFKYLSPLRDLEVPVYKHNSVTGRLSIQKGVNYLTMKKSERNKLRSSLKDHTLFELDFKSCEPNLYVRSFNIVPSEVNDVYAYISEAIGLKEVNRAKFKRTLLSILYGANERAVSKISKLDIKKIKKIKELLRVQEFDQILQSEYDEHGYIRNMFGRPILSDANLVNYWIQSSAVDYCCLSFLSFFQDNPEFKLHAVIHDAVIFSVPNDLVVELNKIKYLSYDKLAIPVEIKPVTDNS